MSNKRHVNAALAGYDGPFFPPETDELRRTLDVTSINGRGLEKVAKNTREGFRKRDKVTTIDGYSWFWALHFRKIKGETVILIPWSQDWDNKDGTENDRSIAVHTKRADEAQAAEVVKRFAEAVHNLWPTIDSAR